MREADAYVEIRLTVPPDVAEAVGALLFEEGIGGLVTGVTEFEPDVRGGREDRDLIAFVAAARAETVLARLRDYLGELRALRPEVPHAPRVRPIPTTAWEETWKEHFPPLRIGPLLVVPPWHAAAEEPGAIRIEPGRAFGTGHHVTTRHCLEALVRLAAERSLGRALDVGTGSGILAIAMARLGAAEVLALDTDPVARAAARAAVARNRPACVVQVRGDDIAKVPGRFDTAVANLSADVLTTCAPGLAGCLRPGARLVISGVTRDQQTTTLAAFTAAGCRTVEVCEESGWSTTVLANAPG